MSKLPTIQAIQEVVKSRIFRVEAVDLEFSNGEKRSYERLNSGSSGPVFVVPLDGDEILMVREYAVGLERYELGFVKGLIDPGEEAPTAANRELQEEIGMGARELEFVRALSVVPHYSCAQTQLFIARDLYPSLLEGDEPEPLELERFPLSAIDELLQHPEISDARTLFALCLIQKLS